MTVRPRHGDRHPQLWAALAFGVLAVQATAIASMPGEPASVAPALPSRPKAAATLAGTPAKGLAVTLSGAGSSGGGLTYRWIQTRGTPVEIAEPTGPTIRVAIPDDATDMTFLLIVANREGIDCATVSIPRPAASSSPADPSLKADAGDDQLGLVGRQITLNAIRSEPRGKIGFRWLQIAGPAVTIRIVDSNTYTFVPQAAGIYRFALVVAAGSEISEADTVDVTVGSSANVVGGAPPATGATAPARAASEPSLPPVKEFARSLLGAIDGGPAKADDLARNFEGVADRIDLYGSFADAFSEMAKRLETVVPAASPARPGWDRDLFTPLTNRLVLGLRPEGVDLARVESHAAPMTPAQRKRLAELLREMAAGFRGSRAGNQAD